MNPIATAIAEHITRWLTPGTPLIVGLCGTQASGKSTASAQLAEHFGDQGLNVGLLSLDDLYMGRTVRAEMAKAVHPLFATRGPPGTHDTAIGIATLDAVKRGDAIMLPRFDKRADEPLSSHDWPLLESAADLLIFEGWCVGALSVPADRLGEPINALEREDDADGIWRRHWNAHLSGPTAELFARLDRLTYLRPPSFEVVHRWRCEQERDYQAAETGERAAAAMTDDQVVRFIAHYERLTRWIIEEMPGRADVTIALDERRNVQSVGVRP
jgi:D-glycerate 3-kinase